MYEIKVEKFEGPLDLLLRLIERDELDITEVSLAKVTDQYIAQMERLPELSPEELADFLVVAAKLLFIKSRSLLPYLTWEEDEEDGDLERRLKMYREYVEAAQKMQDLISKKRFTYVREKPPVSAMGFIPPRDFSSEKLATMFLNILVRLEPIVITPEEVMERTVSIHEKIKHIKEVLLKHGNISFKQLMAKSKTRNEIVVSFLALLELVKQKHLQVKQEENFSEINLSKVKGSTHVS